MKTLQVLAIKLFLITQTIFGVCNADDSGAQNMKYGIWELEDNSFFIPQKFALSISPNFKNDNQELPLDSIVFFDKGIFKDEKFKLSNVYEITELKRDDSCGMLKFDQNDNLEKIERIIVCKKPWFFMFAESTENTLIPISGVEGLFYKLGRHSSYDRLTLASGRKTKLYLNTGYAVSNNKLPLTMEFTAIRNMRLYFKSEDISEIYQALEKGVALEQKINFDKKQALLEKQKLAEANYVIQEKNAEVFRNDLKSGDESQCGLVIEVKPPIARVQIGGNQVWVKVIELYPRNSNRACTIRY